MAYTIILSGPGGFESQARKSLADAGFAAHDSTVDHLLPHNTDGSSDPTVSFLSLEADDINGPPAAVASLGWNLRAHYLAPMVVSPLLSDVAADEEARLRQIIREEMGK